MVNVFRRRSRRQEPSLLPLLSGGIPEAHIAVGSLSRVAPSDIQGYLLITIRHDGRAKLTRNACPELAATVLSDMAAVFARHAYAAHECGGTETEGAER